MKYVEEFWKLNTQLARCGFSIMNSFYTLNAEREQKILKVTSSMQEVLFTYFLLWKGATSAEEEEDVPSIHVVNTDIGEMPEGAQVSDGEEPDSRPSDDPHKALDINLDE